MSVANSNTSPKCLICFRTILIERIKNSKIFTKVFDTFCRLLKIDLIKPMQWDFEEDHIPFCDFCRTVIEKLKCLYDQIEALEQQTENMLNRIKHEIHTSGSDIIITTNELTANDRVNYFRDLVVGGSSCEDNNSSVNTKVISSNLETRIKIETQLDPQTNMELPLLEGINESCEFENEDIEIDPLLTVKRETDDTSNCSLDVEPFPQNNLESVTDSIFLDTNTPVCSVEELYSRSDEKAEIDLEDHHRCRFCKKTFRRKVSLQLHLKEHLDEKKINYGNCNGTFLSKNDLIFHRKQVHGSQSHNQTNSDIINNSETKPVLLEFPRFDLPLNGVEHEKKNNLCEVCEKGDAASEEFSSFHSLTCYKRIHSGKMKYKCDYCGKRLEKQSYLIRHRRSHTGEKPYKCDVCFKTFTQSYTLVEHKRLHTGEKPFKCDICDEAFIRAKSLTIHKRRHTGERLHECEICFKNFNEARSLVYHKSLHTGEKPFKCDICNKLFAHSRSLAYHKKMHTGEGPYKCGVCDKIFRNSLFLLRHMRNHTGEKPYKCEVCFKTFSLSGSLFNHKRNHTGEKPYKCEVCNKAFTFSSHLTDHKRTHTGEKPYKCEVCNKMFGNSSILCKHKRVHVEKS